MKTINRLGTCAAVTAIPFLLLLSVSAAAEATPIARVIRVNGGIAAFAMDGPRIAYEEHATAKTCNRTFIFNVVTGEKDRIRGCRPDYGGRELAIAGRRIVWIITGCGNSECGEDLATASLPGLRAHSLAHAQSEGDEGGEELAGTFIQGLVGSGKLLAVNRWTGYVSGGMITMTKSGLDLIGPKGLRRIAAGPNTTFAQAADSGRVAVLRRDGTVGIYNASGKLVVEVKPGPVDTEQHKTIALRGEHLLVLTKAQRLEIYNSQTGALVRRWPVLGGAASLDTFADLAVYGSLGTGSRPSFKLHVLRLTTGKDIVLGKAGSGIQLEASGLVYNTSTTLVFVPLRRLLAAVS
jgi:hypothetical protein